MSDRKREVVEAKVKDSQGKTLHVSAYLGMLPEDVLVLLSQQSVMLRTRGNKTRTDLSAVWHGPSEQIQTVLTNGSIFRGIDTSEV